LKQIANETGYNTDTVSRLLDRFQNVHRTLEYCKETKEILILNWFKYNWTASPKLDKPLLKDIESIKNEGFRNYVGSLYNQREPLIPYRYPIDTTVSVSVSDTVSVTDTDTEAEEKKKPVAHKYGEYGWVQLTDDQYQKLVADIGEDNAIRCIAYVDESAQGTGNKNKWKDWNLVVRKCHREGWGIRSWNQNKVGANGIPINNQKSDLEGVF
jgi:hypothetical protein